MSVVILGAFPPPIGGNSVHIQRLYSALRRRGESVEVLDYLGIGSDSAPPDVHRLRGSTWSKLLGVLRFARRTPHDAVIHMHVSGMGRFKWIAPFLVASFWRQPRVVTIHSGSFVRSADRFALRRYLGLLLRRFDRVIVVNEQQRDFLLRIGLKQDRVHVIPAFLIDESEVAFEAPLAAEVGRGKLLVVTSGYLTRLYNYDVLIESAKRLPNDKFHFVFAFYHEVDREYEALVLERLSTLPNVTVLRNRTPGEFLALLKRSQVYVRSTRADGDAVAVREALHFGNRVLATTSVPRPSACELFDPDDVDRLEELLASASEAIGHEAPRAPRETTDSLADLLEVYERASESRRTASRAAKKLRRVRSGRSSAVDLGAPRK